MKVSTLAENIVGSEIIKIGAEIQEKIKSGDRIHNLTIGDFNPKLFPIPSKLRDLIVEEYEDDQTNYPPADGVLELRHAVRMFAEEKQNLQYNPQEIMIAAGARPVIYSIFKALVNPNDNVIFPVPSWNNNHYTYLNGATPIIIQTSEKNNFMPSVQDIEPHLKDAHFLALCSPQNPTGTVFTKKGLEEICDAVIEENRRRSQFDKPLYVMYDQIYSELTYGVDHVNPVTLRPEMREYTIFVDGISKNLSATGVRVGWSMGPKPIIDKMKAILTHIGAWAPRAEQIATAKYFQNFADYNQFIVIQKYKILERLNELHKGIQKLKSDGFSVDSIEPQAGIYLTVKFDLSGKSSKKGNVLFNNEDVRKYLLDDAKLGIVPFYAFGTSHESPWYRMSVGTLKTTDIPYLLSDLREALINLN